MIYLCKKQAVPENGALRVAPPGRPAIAIYDLGGALYATDDRCSHGNASLSAGFIEGSTIVCPLHFGSFDIRTGMPVDPPCTREVASHRLAVSGDDVLLDESS